MACTRQLLLVQLSTSVLACSSLSNVNYPLWALRHYSRSAPIEVKDSPYSITERRVPELMPVLGSQPAEDVSHKPDGGCRYFSSGLQ